MKRSILFSLMMIGAVASLIAGATFAPFTDEDTLSGTITAGNVQVSFGETTSLSWEGLNEETCFDPQVYPTPTVIGSEDVCTSTVSLTYGNPVNTALPAELDFTLMFGSTPANCFLVEMVWVGQGVNTDDAEGTAGPLTVLNQTAENGTITVNVKVNPLLGLESTPTLNACQDKSITLTLTVTATEVTQS